MANWISGLRSLVAGQKAKAEDVNFNFDKLQELLNEAFQSGRVQATAKPTLGGVYVDITGASKTLTVPRKSLLVAVATFDVTMENTTDFYGILNVNGVDQTQEAFIHTPGGISTNARQTVTQTYTATLEAGSRTVKMRAKKNGGTCEIFDLENTGFSYFLYPHPEQ